MNKINPLDLNAEVELITTFKVDKIIQAYKRIGIDVVPYLKNLESINLFKCKNTSYRFYYPFSSIGDANFYKTLSLTRKNYYSKRWEHRKAIKILSSGEKVLEIGCGFGVFLDMMKSKKISAEGIELNPIAINDCYEKGLVVHNDLIEKFAVKNHDKFDVVCFFQVLEHIVNVHDFIKSSLEVLKPNGKLIIGVPNNNPYLFINDKYHALNMPPHHAGLWNKESLKSLQKLFKIKLLNVYYEPLEETYCYFIANYIKNANILCSLCLKALNKIVPKILKKLLCRFIKGRNILIEFTKIV